MNKIFGPLESEKNPSTFGVSLGWIPLLCRNNVRADATHFQNQSRMMDGVKSGN